MNTSATELDFSTINPERLRALRRYIKPPSYKLSKGVGAGCFGDAPGYPSYFLKYVYTKYGNPPRKGPETVILHEGTIYIVSHSKDWKAGDTWDDVHARFTRLLRRLWLPLPIDHQRVRLWMQAQYAHLKHCYRDTAIKEYGRSPGTLISYANNRAGDRRDLVARWDQSKYYGQFETVAHAIEHAREVTSDLTNHRAVVAIRRFYPDHEPIKEWIAYPPHNPPCWWEVFAAQPANREECQAQLNLRYGKYGSWKHPIGTTHCQQCGWTAGERRRET